MSTNGILIPGTLQATCFSSIQEMYNEMFDRGTVTFADTAIQYVISNSTPSADDRDKLWIQVGVANQPVGWWTYYNGAWVRPHELSASSQERRLWVGSTAALETHDGGEAGAVGASSGPMWEVDTDFDNQYLAGPGTFPASSTVLSVGSEIGSDQITLTTAQLPEHRHKIGTQDAYSTNPGASVNQFFATSSSFRSNENYASTYSGTTDPEGSGSAITIIPPTRGIYVIKRTARIYRKAA